MHPPELRTAAMELIAYGLNDCEVSRRTGVARTTIRDWRRPPYARTTFTEACPRCWRATRPQRFATADYSELLAMYLGDGSISDGSRTQRLRIALDTKYPAIIAATVALLERCFLGHGVDATAARGCVQLSVYSSHHACLFPQHGPGKKHHRRIVLEDWQRAIVDREPWPFIRGLIRTDGCVFINRTDIHRDQPYEYLTYGFTNMSEDIVGLFRDVCEQVGVAVRDSRDSRGCWHLRINRRESVALMDEHVGAKC